MVNPSFIDKNSAPYSGYISLTIRLILIGVRFGLGLPVWASMTHWGEQYFFRWLPVSTIFGLNIVPQMGQGTSFRIRALFRHVGEQNSNVHLEDGTVFLVNSLEQYLQINSRFISTSKINTPGDWLSVVVTQADNRQGCDLIIAQRSYSDNYLLA